jgi:polar amino acid transport system substrate-binding protein
MKIKFLAVIVFFIFSNTSFGCEVKVGYEEWPIYIVKNKDGSLHGLDIELFEAVAQASHCKIKYIELPWVRELKSIENGEIDIVMSASKTPEREVYAYFSKANHDETNSLFLNKGLGNSIKTIKELGASGLKIAYEKGAFLGDEIETIKDKLDSSGNNINVNIKNTLAKRIDGFIVDKYAGSILIKKNKANEQIIMHPLLITTGDVHIMVSKKTKVKDLLQLINKGIDKIKSNGTYKKILQKYN